MSTARLVVGVDGPGSRAPLEWAVNEAVQRNVELDVVHAFHPGHDVSPIGLPGPAIDMAPYEAAAKTMIDDAVAGIPPTRRGALRNLQRITVPDAAGAALVEASKGADLLVVGQRGRGPLSGLLGSVSHQVVHHAACPVTVVPLNWPAADVPSRIVVGVDGSEPSQIALRWALDETARWTSELVVVHAWNTPYPVEPWGLVVTPKDQEQFEERSRELIEAMLDRAVADGAHRPRAWTARTVEDAAGPALVHAAMDADLLVVGSRGRGGFAALLVGSTSLQCLHRATCPVTIVPSR